MSQVEAEEAIRVGRLKHEILVQGRAHRIMIKARANEHRADTMTIVYNIHNFGLVREQVDTIASRISAESSVAAQSPYRTTVLAAGGFNYAETAAMHLH
eukprot:769099-Pyramimonas_sp.AAC.1